MSYGDDNAGVWLLVKPTIGLPLFIGGVAVTSLIVHWALLTHTTWFPAYWQGHAKAAVVGTIDPAPDKTAAAQLASK